MTTAHQGYLDGNRGKAAACAELAYIKGYEAGVEDLRKGFYYPDYSKGAPHEVGDWIKLRRGALVEERRSRTTSQFLWRHHTYRIKIRAILPEVQGHLDERGNFVRPRVAQICWMGSRKLNLYAAFSDIYSPPEDA